MKIYVSLIVTVFLMVTGARAALAQASDTRRLLTALSNVRTDSDKLSALFKSGDENSAELIKLLDDPDPEVSLGAQIVIRYLGNETGMKALREWFTLQQREYRVAGPIPLPLAEWDYILIETNLMKNPSPSWSNQGFKYIYALALDGSERAEKVLTDLSQKAADLNELTFVRQAIKRLGSKEFSSQLRGNGDLDKLVLNNAFFVSASDRKYMSGRLLALNGAKNKALVEVYINRGPLAEEWYHVVVRKSDQGWKFLSITQVAVS